MIPESLQSLLFWVVAAVAVLSAGGVVLNRNAIYSALSLLVNFTMLAVLYLLLNAQFIAMVQVIVYAGAVVVLFVFVEMLLGATGRIQVSGWLTPHLIVAVVAGFLLLSTVGSVVYESAIGGMRGNVTPEVLARAGQVQVLGITLYTDYLLAVQLAGVLMLVGLVGALQLGQQWQRARPSQSAESAPRPPSAEVESAATGRTDTRESGG
ncbi:MAG: NADH-quinone oxidoreductase subunit J [Anaerolineae bacterium]